MGQYRLLHLRIGKRHIADADFTLKCHRRIIALLGKINFQIADLRVLLADLVNHDAVVNDRR